MSRLIDADALIEFCAERWIPLNIDAVNMQPTIQPEKAQLSSEDATFDLISRQAAIDAAKDWYEGLICGSINGLIKRLNALPTIQPQSTTGQLNDGAQSTARSTDLIDRQAAIDAIVQCTNCGDEDTLREYVLKHSLDNGWTGGILEALDAVKDLPTVPPEPHEGHWIEGEIYRDVIECNCSECGQLMTTAATVRMNFCPNCGAKMKGAQNG